MPVIMYSHKKASGRSKKCCSDVLLARSTKIGLKITKSGSVLPVYLIMHFSRSGIQKHD